MYIFHMPPNFESLEVFYVRYFDPILSKIRDVNEIHCVSSDFIHSISIDNIGTRNKRIFFLSLIFLLLFFSFALISLLLYLFFFLFL